MAILATIHIPSTELLGDQSIVPLLLIPLLAVMGSRRGRARRIVVGVAPSFLLLTGIALASMWHWYLDGQHHVAQIVVLGGAFGFALYGTRKETGSLRTWSCLSLIVIGAIIAHFTTGLAVDGWPYPSRSTVMGILTGGLVVLASTWGLWILWAMATRVVTHRRPAISFRCRPRRTQIWTAVALWIALAGLWAMNLAIRWSKQGPAVRIVTSRRCYLEFRDAGGIETIFPPPIEELNPLCRLQVRGPDMRDDDLRQIAQAGQLRHVYIYNAPGVTDQGLRYLQGLRNLEVLELDRTGVTREGLEDLRKALPHVTTYGPN